MRTERRHLRCNMRTLACTNLGVELLDELGICLALLQQILYLIILFLHDFSQLRNLRERGSRQLSPVIVCMRLLLQTTRGRGQQGRRTCTWHARRISASRLSTSFHRGISSFMKSSSSSTAHCAAHSHIPNHINDRIKTVLRPFWARAATASQHCHPLLRE